MTTTYTEGRRKRGRSLLGQLVFADSAFWIALTSKRDDYHSQAQRWRRHLVATQVSILTTEAVLWEWLNSLAAPRTRVAAAQGYAACKTDSKIEVITLDAQLEQAALVLYQTLTDKGWGLTDCLSFVVMRQRDISDALTADRDFQQAGFRTLLREDPLQ